MVDVAHKQTDCARARSVCTWRLIRPNGFAQAQKRIVNIKSMWWTYALIWWDRTNYPTHPSLRSFSLNSAAKPATFVLSLLFLCFFSDWFCLLVLSFPLSIKQKYSSICFLQADFSAGVLLHVANWSLESRGKDLYSLLLYHQRSKPIFGSWPAILAPLTLSLTVLPLVFFCKPFWTGQAST